MMLNSYFERWKSGACLYMEQINTLQVNINAKIIYCWCLQCKKKKGTSLSFKKFRFINQWINKDEMKLDIRIKLTGILYYRQSCTKIYHICSNTGDICFFPKIYYPLEEMTLLCIWVILSAALGSHIGLKWSHPVFAFGTCEGHLKG